MINHVSIEHSPDYETAVQFDYPTEHLPVDVVEQIETLTNDMVRVKTTEAIKRLVLLLENEKNPVLTLKALLYSIGITLTDKGTLTSVAHSLNISKQRLHYNVKNINKRMLAKIKQINKDGNNPFNNL